MLILNRGCSRQLDECERQNDSDAGRDSSQYFSCHCKPPIAGTWGIAPTFIKPLTARQSLAAHPAAEPVNGLSGGALPHIRRQSRVNRLFRRSLAAHPAAEPVNRLFSQSLAAHPAAEPC